MNCILATLAYILEYAFQSKGTSVVAQTFIFICIIIMLISTS